MFLSQLQKKISGDHLMNAPANTPTQQKNSSEERSALWLMFWDETPFWHLYMDVIGPLFEKAEYYYCCIWLTADCFTFAPYDT